MQFCAVLISAALVVASAGLAELSRPVTQACFHRALLSDLSLGARSPRRLAAEPPELYLLVLFFSSEGPYRACRPSSCNWDSKAPMSMSPCVYY